MGLLSKLFGDNKDVEKAAKDLLGGIFSEAAKGGAKEAAEPDRPSENSGWGFEIPSGSGEDRETESAASGPSGESWGPVMPARQAKAEVRLSSRGAERNSFSKPMSWGASAL